MSIGQEAMQAPQYMQMPLLTTSETRFPKIFSFFGNGFQPSPSTLDFRGTGGGAGGAAGFAAGTGPVAGLATGAGVGVGFGFGGVGGLDMIIRPLSLQSVRRHVMCRRRTRTCQLSGREVSPIALATKRAIPENILRCHTRQFPPAHIRGSNLCKSGRNSSGRRSIAGTIVLR